MGLSNILILRRADSGGKPEIYHATEQQRRDSLYRPKEEEEAEEIENPEHIVTNQTDSLDSTTLDIQNSPGGKPDLVYKKDERRSSSGEEDDGSVYSCEEERQIGNAFPKAFDRDLITPANSKKKSSNHLLVMYSELEEEPESVFSEGQSLQTLSFPFTPNT